MQIVNDNKEYSWYKIAKSIEEIKFSPEGTAEFIVADNKICLILSKNSLKACSQKCPHAGGVMSEGYIDSAGNIVCPLHGYKFNLQNGRNITGEGYFLKLFPVEICASVVFVGILKNK